MAASLIRHYDGSVSLCCSSLGEYHSPNEELLFYLMSGERKQGNEKEVKTLLLDAARAFYLPFADSLQPETALSKKTLAQASIYVLAAQIQKMIEQFELTELETTHRVVSDSYRLLQQRLSPVSVEAIEASEATEEIGGFEDFLTWVNKKF